MGIDMTWKERVEVISLGATIMAIFVGFVLAVVWISTGIQNQLDINRAQLIRDARNCTPL